MAILINDNSARVQYTATTNQTVFTVPFEFFANSDLKVYNGSTLLTFASSPANASQYNVSGAGVTGGGSIALGSPGASLGNIITIVRGVPIERTSDFPLSGPFNIEALNTTLDKMTVMLQDVDTKFEQRVPRLAENDTPNTLAAIPNIDQRRNKLFYWDDGGQPSAIDAVGFASVIAYGSVVVNSFTGNGSTTAFTLSEDPSSVNNLIVTVNGVTQTPTTDYSAAGLTLNFTSAPPTDSLILVRYARALPYNFFEAPNGSASIGHISSSAGAVARTVKNKLEDYVSAKDFGAVGNGIADDTVAIQAALNSGAKNILVLAGTYLVTSTLIVPASVNISAYEATFNAASITAEVFRFTNGGGIRGGTINGPGNASYVATSIAVKASGTNNAPSAPTFISSPTVEDVTIDGFGAYGVFLAYVNQPRVINCRITDIGYAGVGGVSCNDGIFSGNYIANVSPGTAPGDAYGIFVDRNNGTSETSDPRSYRCVIDRNIISNVVATGGNNGQGIDTHAGVDFTISNNIVLNCEVGIFVTSSVVGAAQALGPKNVTVIGNVVKSTLRMGYGIQVAGAISGGSVIDYAESITISGNTVTGHGIAGDSTSAAIRLQATKNVIVNGNTVDASSCNGIQLNSDNLSFSVTNNVISNPFDNSYAAPSCVQVLSSNNHGTISGNTFVYNNGALGTYVAINSIRIAASQTNLFLNIPRNNFVGIDATHLLYTQGASTGAINPEGLFAERNTAVVACVSGQANNLVDVTFATPFPVAPTAINLTVAGAIAPGGKAPVLRLANVTASGFRIIAYPTDLGNWSASGNLDLVWRASV
jgi:hypothetical protein